MKCLLVLALLLCAFSSAGLCELSRGDRGEDVRAVQEYLIELGFLHDKADGIFGRKTESAVKALAAYLNMPSSGRLSKELELQLYELHCLVTGDSSGKEILSEELPESYPTSCSWKDEDVPSCCRRHTEQGRLFELWKHPGTPSELSLLLAGRIRELWLRDILAMYESWSGAVGAEQKAIFLQSLRERRRDWDDFPEESTFLEADWLLHIGVDLCFDLYGAEPQGSI